MPELTIIHADGTETQHDLEQDVVTVGRLDDNLIQIEHPSVSSHHAQLTMTGGDYHLKDLNSTNGTRVNGVPISEKQLREGDRLRFGKVEAIYHSKTSAGGAMPLPDTGEIRASVSARSARPDDFANPSPFRKPAKKRDPAGVATMTFALFTLALMAFAVVFLLTLTPPV